MKALILFCLFCTLSVAQNTLFLLPHRWIDARHRLLDEIRSAPRQIVVVTSRLDDRQLEKALRGALRHEKHIELLTTSARTASKWAIYRDVSVCLLPNPLRFSMLIAQNVCLASGDLTTDAFKYGYGFVRCDTAIDSGQTLAWLRRDCRPYLTAESP